MERKKNKSNSTYEFSDKEFKLLFLDVDGTITNSSPIRGEEVKLDDLLVSYIQELKGKIHISLCTGRDREGCIEIMDLLDIRDSFHVMDSGAKIFNPKGKIEHISILSKNVVREVMDYAGKLPIGMGIRTNSIWKDSIDEVGEDEEVTVISLHSDNSELTKSIVRALSPLRKKYNIAVGTHWEYKEGGVVIITQKEATKGFGVKFVQKKLGVRKSQTICIGDAMQDLTMFEEVGFKIAMGNAHEELKKEADLVTGTVEEDGVVKALKAILNSGC